jgi:hypothetical protein
LKLVPGLGSHRAEVFVKSKRAIAAGCGGQRHEGARSGSSCCGSRDVGSARKSQGVASLELNARESVQTAFPNDHGGGTLRTAEDSRVGGGRGRTPAGVVWDYPATGADKEEEVELCGDWRGIRTSGYERSHEAEHATGIAVRTLTRRASSFSSYYREHNPSSER